jgi:hypothetical protein
MSFKGSPEKLVEQQVKAWCFKNNIWVNVYDSKATFSPITKSFKRTSAMRIGQPDLMGLNNQGLFVAIELKAPTKEKVCRIEQRDFLVKVIEQGGFGCVVSSVETLNELYSNYIKTKDKDFLINALPKKVLINGKTIELALD